MEYLFNVPEKKKLRLIISSDAKIEADDQYAIAHALLTPKFIIKSIIAAQFGTRRMEHSMEESYKEIKRILSLMDMDDKIHATRGAVCALKDENTPEISEGAQIIIEEAMKDDPLPLFIISLGALTDIASAYLLEPQIAERLIVIWIGGGIWPEGNGECNLGNDIHAANVVFKSNIPLWQVPMDVYSMMRISLAELQLKVRPYGKIGQYLFQQLVDFNDAKRENPDWPSGECWSLGDSATIGLLLDKQGFGYVEKEAPCFDSDMKYIHDCGNRKIRVYNTVNTRFIMEDFFCKLALNYPISR
jgi:Inosine-uridine nucleoside N-ribohydrolase